jgi:alkyl hydroperoxide reductase subunit D
MDELKQRLPDHARDLRINLNIITSSTALSAPQAWGIAVASAHATRRQDLASDIEAASGLDATQLQAARGAASIMAMNNVYYRFLHMMGEASDYPSMPARLRMQIIGNPGVPKLDFELACLAASAITGCASCVRSHEEAVRASGGTKEMVQDAVRIAAVLNGVATAMPAA